MKRFLHGLAHVGLISLQVANVAAPFVPPPFNIAVAGGAGIIQGILAMKNHKKP